MSAIKVFGGITLSLFVFVGLVGTIKKNKQAKQESIQQVVVQADLNEQVLQAPEVYQEMTALPDFITAPIVEEPVVIKMQEQKVEEEPVKQDIIDVDRVDRMFSRGKNKLPFVETITYKSRVSWLQGRPAWIADYANYFQTSRHFIARSLNGNRDYYTQKVASGDQFNVFSKSSDVRFHLVVDLSKLKLWFYAYDKVSNYRFL